MSNDNIRGHNWRRGRAGTAVRLVALAVLVALVPVSVAAAPSSSLDDRTGTVWGDATRTTDPTTLVVELPPLRAEGTHTHDDDVGGAEGERGVDGLIVHPSDVLERTPGAQSRAVTDNITVAYIGAPPAAARNAFEAAVDIWASRLQFRAPVAIEMRWEPLSGGALGRATLGLRTVTGSPGTFYPDALANQLAGVDLSAGSYEMVVTMNSNSTWYLGTDGQTPAGQHDFVTVALHELGHGLGFMGSLRGDPDPASAVAGWGLGSGIPVIYDRFAVQGTTGLPVVGALANPSVELKAMLTGGDLWFRGPNSTAASGGHGVQLYAPNPEVGSSYSHSDPVAYPNGTQIGLMRPSLITGVAVHDPGPVLVGLMADLGWLVSVDPGGELRVTTDPPLPARVFVDGVPRNVWGLSWMSIGAGAHEVCFSGVPGFVTPPCTSVTVGDGQTTVLEGSFSALGALKVEVDPAGLPSTIIIDGIPRNDYGLLASMEPGTYEVCWGAVPGHQPPPCQQATVTAGGLEVVVGQFTAQPGAPGPPAHGLLRVETSPAVPARITVNGVARNDWGLDWVKVPPGTYVVCASDVVGFAAPACQTVAVAQHQTTVATMAFSPLGVLQALVSPAGLPATVYVNGTPHDTFGVQSYLDPGFHQVCFGDVPGRVTPSCRMLTVTAGTQTTTTGVFPVAS